MGLRIQNNIAAMNAHRQLSIADTNLTKSLQRLSSGYRINTAADDAAGLAISESFRADIASFKVAYRNTSEAASLLQVAEGGMDQVGNMLTRLKELATQASSANVGSSERTKIDSEADKLISEIDRIANGTKYGSTNLLDASFGNAQNGAMSVYSAGVADRVLDDANDNIRYTLSATTAGAGVTVDAIGSTIDEDKTWFVALISGAGADSHQAILRDSLKSASATSTELITYTSGTTELAFSNLGVTFSFSAGLTAAIGMVTDVNNVSDSTQSKLSIVRTGMTSLNVASALTGVWTISDTGDDRTITITYSDGSVSQQVDYVASGNTITFDSLNISFVLGDDYSWSAGDLDGMKFTVSAGTGSAGNTFQIGAENNSYNQIAISIDGVRTSDLGINSLDLSTTANAQQAINLIDTAISTLAGSRGTVGAYQNRLSYAAANLSTITENMQAAESVIRDVDMAAEMTSFTKNQILMQAGTAMLAQANMSPQQVLSLFG